jgi:Amidohydrolase family
MKRMWVLMLTVVGAGLGSVVHAADPSDGRVLRYTVLSNGHVAGSGEDSYRADGVIDSRYEYNDRGRGPKITAHYRLSATGIPLHSEITGNDYLKAPVDEHFDVSHGQGRWYSTTEHGRTKAEGFYIGNNSPPSELALLAAALIKAKGAPIALLPAGEARLERVTDATVHSSSEKRHVTEYAITGLSFDPQTVWLDEENRFFGSPGKWYASLRYGFEAANDELYSLQQRAEDSRLAELARSLAHHPTGPVAIEHVRVFDAEHAVALGNQTVLIDGDRITYVGPDGDANISGAVEHIEGAGKTLIPALVDLHAHVQALDGLLNVASGVTAVRDMGNDIDELKHLQDAWDGGAAIGPRVWKAGLIDGRGPFQAPTGLYADSPAEALAAVDRYADLGYVQIKLYSSLNPEFVAAIAKQAHARGLRVSGHVPNGMIASQFVTAGADEIQHINFVMLNFMDNKVLDTRTPDRFKAVAAQSAGLDLNSQPVTDFIELLKQHRTTLDLTLGAFEPMFVARPGLASPDYAPIIARLPAQVQRGAYNGGLPAPGSKDLLYKKSYAKMLAMAGKLYDAGIPILAGTDAIAGFGLHRELELEVQVGIPPAKALQIATWNAAHLLDQNADFGAVAAGKRADLLLVDGNPLERISDIRRCRLVFKNGTLYRSAEVYAAVGVKPAP